MRWILASAIFLCAACNGRVSQQLDTGADEAGDTGSMLPESCVDGCAAFVSCHPDGYEALYPDDDCEATCEASYAECEVEAIDYSDCVIGLGCSEWPDLLDDPANTVCGPAWSALSGCLSSEPTPDP